MSGAVTVSRRQGANGSAEAPRASTAPTPTATSSRSCGCCRARPVARTGTQLRFTDSTCSPRSPTGPACAPPGSSSPRGPPCDRLLAPVVAAPGRPTRRRGSRSCCTVAGRPTRTYHLARQAPASRAHVRGGASSVGGRWRVRLLRQPRHRPACCAVAARCRPRVRNRRRATGIGRSTPGHSRGQQPGLLPVESKLNRLAQQTSCPPAGGSAAALGRRRRRGR